MQGSQYPEWRQVADDLDGLQEEARWGRREKRPDRPTRRGALLPLPFEREEPLEEEPLPPEREGVPLVARK